MGFLMLKHHKPVKHLEGVTIDKVIRISNGNELFLNFLLFNDCQLEIMCFIHLFDNMFLFSNHNVTLNTSINLPPSCNFFPKIVPLTGTVPLTYFMGYSESVL